MPNRILQSIELGGGQALRLRGGEGANHSGRFAR